MASAASIRVMKTQCHYPARHASTARGNTRKVVRMKNREIAWYLRWPGVVDEVMVAKAEFEQRLAELGGNSFAITQGLRRDFLARAVHESNWQEGYEIEIGRTRVISDQVFKSLAVGSDGFLDCAKIVEAHRLSVVRLSASKASVEEIATFNLSVAHVVLNWIFSEVCAIVTAHLLKSGSIELQRAVPNDQERAIRFLEWENIVTKELESKDPVFGPVTGSTVRRGDRVRALMANETELVNKPFDVRYLHTLHAIVAMGMLDDATLGTWRTSSVHVGNPNIDFPPWEAVPAKMNEFCRMFPWVSNLDSLQDSIWQASLASYRFVRIHPYADGNGRMSRLIMNFVLQADCPVPISLAPRAKERHRYKQAIYRADRGKLEPLACLVAIAMHDAFVRMKKAISLPI